MIDGGPGDNNGSVVKTVCFIKEPSFLFSSVMLIYPNNSSADFDRKTLHCIEIRKSMHSCELLFIIIVLKMLSLDSLTMQKNLTNHMMKDTMIGFFHRPSSAKPQLEVFQIRR